MAEYTRWFKYDRDCSHLFTHKLVPVIFEPPCISVGEALKLVSPFKEDKREVLAFISNVDTAFEVINPENSDIL